MTIDTTYDKWLLEAKKSLAKISSTPELDIRWIGEHCQSLKDPQACMKDLICRRLKGEPVAYLIKERGFFKHIFKTHPDVLIPRPETEQLLETALDWAKEHTASTNKVPTFLDIGCGSGCLGISLSKELGSLVHCIDISDSAIALTKENIENLKASKVSFEKLDAASLNPKQLPFKVDAVVTNPPYIAEDDPVDPFVKKYEPHLALYGGGPLGLDLFSKWIEPILSLEPLAVFIETSPTQWSALSKLLSEHFESVEMIRDYSGQERILKVLSKK